MDFVGAIKAGFKNYVNFRGTATLPEYWYWVLFTFLVSLVISFDPTGTLGAAFAFGTLLPSLGVLVRRLRDAGFSWLWILTPIPGLIPFTNGLIVLLTELYNRGIDGSILDGPQSSIDAFVKEIIAIPEVMNALGLILVSLLYILFTSLLVNVIFPIRKSKSFEEGNKRVTPKGPETPAL